MSWDAQHERGAPWLLRLGLWAVLGIGWPLGQALLLPITAWFLLTSTKARAASRDYLRRVLGRPASLQDVARHFYTFAAAVLDRVFLLAGRHARYRIETEGLDALTDLLAAGNGAILLGAHLGSFEVLRLIAQQSPVPVWALMYRRHTGPLTRLLDRLAPGLNDRVIEIGDTASMLRAHECVARGELVGILGDRAPTGHQMVMVPFLGEDAGFPAGPFILAATLGAPVVLFRAVRTGPRRYTVRFEPFADQIGLRRSHRAADLQFWIARYAARLEDGCRAHPYNWFNFYPFWTRRYAPHPPRPDALAADRPGARG